jgi:peptidoglycan/LPS O-acetylase OafA/YrhL
MTRALKIEATAELTENRVEDVVAPPPGHPRFPHLDGVRALAVASVFLVHQYQIIGSNAHDPWGVVTARLGVGVPIFFILSAFLLYRPFLAAWRGHAPPIRVRDYARRRALRILPGYWVALTVCALTVGLVDVFSNHWWAYYGFLQVYDEHTYFLGLGAAWSLCAEVAFYAVLPLYVLARTRKAPAPGLGWARRELAALGAIACLGLLIRALLKADGRHLGLTGSLAGTADWFAIGLAFAVLSVAVAEGLDLGRARLLRRPNMCWALAGGAFAATCAIGLPRTSRASGWPGGYTLAQFMAEHVLYAIVAALLVAPAIFAAEVASVPGRILGGRVARWLGIVSFGVFLYHVPVQEWLQRHGTARGLPGSVAIDVLAISVPVTLALATLSYFLVERPAMRWKYRGRTRTTEQRAVADASSA